MKIGFQAFWGIILFASLALAVQAQELKKSMIFPEMVHWTSAQIKLYEEQNQAKCKEWTAPEHHWECEKATACSVQKISKEIPFIMYVIAGNERSKAKLSKADQELYQRYMKKLGDIQHHCALGF